MLIRILTPAGLLLLGACAGHVPPADPYAAGKDFLAKNQMGLALESFRHAIQAEGRSVRVLNALGAVHDAMGRSDLADTYYREALTLQPGDVQTMNNLGYSLLLRRRARDAADLLTQAAAAAPGDALIARNLSLAMAEAKTEPEPPGAEPPPPAAAPREPAKPVPLGPWLERSARAVMTLRTDLAAYRQAVELDAEPAIALPAAPPEPVPTPVPVAAAAAASACAVELANGNGRAGAAARLRTRLKGVAVARLTNASSFAIERTVIAYAPGCATQAARLATLLPRTVALVPLKDGDGGVRVVLGRDLLPYDRTTEV